MQADIERREAREKVGWEGLFFNKLEIRVLSECRITYSV
jgi:hypothetical protein